MWYCAVHSHTLSRDTAPYTHTPSPLNPKNPRYIVLHHAGGYYSDSDVTCVRPVAGMAPPGDTLLAVWEGAWSSEAETVANSFGRQAQASTCDARHLSTYAHCGADAHARSRTREFACVTRPAPKLAAPLQQSAYKARRRARSCARRAPHMHTKTRRQVANWFMAAAPGHPALRYVMEHVRLHAASRMFDDASRDTVERTGPGAWTEAVLFAAFRSPPSQQVRTGGARGGASAACFLVRSSTTTRSQIGALRRRVNTALLYHGVPSSCTLTPQGGAWGARVLPKIVAGWHPHDYGWMAPPVYLVHTFRSSWCALWALVMHLDDKHVLALGKHRACTWQTRDRMPLTELN